ncbi:DUF1707 domain-containing protein [Streptomyces sp. NPDC046881]|uniref:DUF1707 SHOCT-like domain-containing protein n=1 Tax=Streptomyces sp. NPDC046881 TaxID=3155374 RepID=UPI0033C9C3EC
MLASEEDRERVVERVRGAVADGRLPLEELDGRLTRVHGARTPGELRSAAHGLPELGSVPPRFTAWSMWGGGRLDLTEARFAARETVIRAVVLWGGTGIVVPDDIDVEVRGFGLFGVFGGRGARRTGRPGAPRVVVKGIALFGAVVVKSKQEKR